MENLSSIKISVVMTTYNGEAYIIEQLESIRCQTKSPDEVIICDDSSKDSTFKLIQNYITEHQLVNWNLVCNNPNIGWKHNFFKATKLATGDIIFFSDQDDIWKEDKIEKMTLLMSKYQMDCLYGDKNIIDKDGNYLYSRMEKTSFTGDVKEIRFSNSFYEKKTLGCCMCINRKIADIYINTNIPEDGHDSQCGRIALLCGTLWHVDAPVINYRIHTGNTSGVNEKASFGQSSLTRRVEDINNSIKWLYRMLEMGLVKQERMEIIHKCIKTQERRFNYLNGNLHLFSLIKCYPYYTGIRMFMGDIMYKHSLNKIAGNLLWAIKRT